MSKEVKRYEAVHIRYEDGNIRYGEGCEVEVVTAADYDALLAERDSLKKDAERYRWLRDIAGNRILNELARDCTMDGWDAKIDAALQGEQP
ncbi:hypothetical protein N5J76_03135 [Pseudomonas sp. GD03855]|nr:hypothetical protein [Pseudomonas sp. GD03856]MDH2263914.1 hypothetical protein [Pseudomonas sp. GD03855]